MTCTQKGACERSGQFQEISAYFRRIGLWNTVYSKKRGVTGLLSHLLTEDLVILLKFFDILDYFLR